MKRTVVAEYKGRSYVKDFIAKDEKDAKRIIEGLKLIDKKYRIRRVYKIEKRG